MTNGHCLCKAVRFTYDGEPKWTLNCHCESCRRAISAPMATWLSIPRGNLRFTAAMPEYYASSSGVRRVGGDAVRGDAARDRPVNLEKAPQCFVFPGPARSWLNVGRAKTPLRSSSLPALELVLIESMNPPFIGWFGSNIASAPVMAI